MKKSNHPLRKSKDEPPVADAPAVGVDMEAMREQIEVLAYQLWLPRGCPVGSPEVDWLRAEEEMRNGHSRKELPRATPGLAVKRAGM